MFVAIVTAFGSILNRSRQGAGCNGPKRATGTRRARLSEADVMKLLQSRANWLGCRVLHCCSVDLVVLKVRLSPGSDRIADVSADSGLCQQRTSPLLVSANSLEATLTNGVAVLRLVRQRMNLRASLAADLVTDGSSRESASAA